jgi:hypothetical protein
MTPHSHRQPSARFPKDQPMRPTATATTNGVDPARGSRRPLAHRAVSALTVLAAAAAVTLSLTASPALADTCPNAALRPQNNSTALPDCRAYELVTNPFKEAFEPFGQAFTDDGNALAYFSVGNFAGNGLGAIGGNEYVANRSAAGWTTTALSPSGPEYAKDNAPATALSTDLRSSLWLMSRADQSAEVRDFYVRQASGDFTRVGPSANPASLLPNSPGDLSFTAPPVSNMGASADLSHVIFTVEHTVVYPGTAVAGNFNLYEYAGTGNERPSLVARDNHGDQITSCDQMPGSLQSTYNAFSKDGQVLFWTSHCADPAISSVWARVDGTTTYDVAASLCTRTAGDAGGACNDPSSALFEGADADGTRVYFTTAQQLVNGDTNADRDLYACDIDPAAPPAAGATNSCASLSQVSDGASDANVEGVVRISDDGSSVYFVATGVLAANRGANDAVAVAGDNNLYVVRRSADHSSATTAFVGRLDPSDRDLWGLDGVGGGRMAQTTDDGRFLVLSTFSPLVSSGANADSDDARDAYRYDADTGTLIRLSTAVSGSDGNENGFDATIDRHLYSATNAPSPTDRPRYSLTSDGGAVVFQTSEALSPSDTNGSVDTYEWHGGQVSLISSGRPSHDDQLGSYAWITPSGNDIFFATTSQLTPNDGDTQLDMYDARVGGGFDFTRPAPCSDDQCQGMPSPPPEAPAPASIGPPVRENTQETVPTFAVQKLNAAARTKLAATGRVTLQVTANTPATLAARATATLARRQTTVASARRTVSAAGTYPVVLRLNEAARAQLRRSGKLTVDVLVTDSKVARTHTVVLRLTRATLEKGSSRRIHATASKGQRTAGFGKGDPS